MMFTTGCSDDDDCPSDDELEEQFEDFDDDIYEACIEDEDCNDCEDAYDALIDWIKDNRGCADDDEDDIDDLIDSLEDSKDFYDDYLDC